MKPSSVAFWCIVCTSTLSAGLLLLQDVRHKSELARQAKIMVHMSRELEAARASCAPQDIDYNDWDFNELGGRKFKFVLPKKLDPGPVR